MNNKIISDAEIMELYFNKKMSSVDISKKLNCDSKTIRNRIVNAGFKMRSSSEAHKLKPSRYWFGKHCSNASSERHKRIMKEWWNKEKNGKKIEERNKKISLAMIGEKNHFYGKHHTEETKKIIRERRARQITPLKDTTIEVKIQNFLKQLRIEFFTHHFISEIEHKYNCDIFIPSTKTIIECDGDYFHANPQFYDNNQLREKQLKQRKFDYFRNKELKEEGYRIIRIWENKIRKMEIEEFKIILTYEKGVGA